MRAGIIVAVCILIILIAGGGYYYLHNAQMAKSPSTASAQPTPKNVFSSIQDALSRHLSLKCDYTDTKEIHTVAYIKNGLIRSTVTNKNNPQESGNMILKDKKMYYWNDAGTVAMVMAMPEVTGTAPSVSPTQQNGQQTMQNLEQYKSSCTPATVADSLFELPSNVKFQDMSEMMHTMQAVPTGMPSGMSHEQMQQYMQKYQPSSQ